MIWIEAALIAAWVILAALIAYLVVDDWAHRRNWERWCRERGLRP